MMITNSEFELIAYIDGIWFDKVKPILVWPRLAIEALLVEDDGNGEIINYIPFMPGTQVYPEQGEDGRSYILIWSNEGKWVQLQRVLPFEERDNPCT